MAPPTQTPDGPLVCTLIYDGLCTFEFGIVVEAFGLPRPEFDHWYRFAVVAAEQGPIRATGGISITADGDLSLLEQADLILIPGWRGAAEPVPETLRAALIAAHARGARIASVCSGAFVLAACGLLAGKRATTHWRYTDMLQQAHASVDVDPDVLFVDNGDVLTSAGSAAGLDLCLHIIRNDFGAAAANSVARRLVLPTQRDGGQRQFVPPPAPKERGGRIGPVMDIIRPALDENWSLKRMADLAGLSPRTLSRRILTATGKSPTAWLISERIFRGQELLETTDLVMIKIAEACGMASVETFRRHYRNLIGTSPSAHRKAFRIRQ